MKPAFEIISHILFWILLPAIFVVYATLVILLVTGYSISYIFDWADARRTSLLEKIILPLTKR